ncbi:phosphatase PAP2 family protein [Helicobacter sp. MIT 03-1614]|nr:phosphatase PAP2 family protein [Helicobacter sp. MIT 03-1614]
MTIRKSMWKKFFLQFALVYFIFAPPPVYTRENQFEQFGDTFRLLPLYVMVVSLAMEDYEGMGQLALGTLSTQLVTEGIKWGFDTAHKNGNSVAFAKRPCCEDWKGMPSGHSSAAFSAAGYVYYRYGWKPAIPVGILAVLTAASRVEAKKHSFLQVSAGALIAWGFSYVFTNKYMPKNTMIMPSVDTDMQGNPSLSLNVRYSF